MYSKILIAELKKPWFARHLPPETETELLKEAKIFKEWEDRSELEKAYLERSTYHDLNFYDHVTVRLCEPRDGVQDIYLFHKLGDTYKSSVKFSFDDTQRTKIVRVRIEAYNSVEPIEISNVGPKYYWDNSPHGQKMMGEMAKIQELIVFGMKLRNKIFEQLDKENVPSTMVDEESDQKFIKDTLQAKREDLIANMKLNFWNYYETILKTMGGY